MLQLLAVVWLENEEVENLLSSGDAVAHILFFPLLNGILSLGFQNSLQSLCI